MKEFNLTLGVVESLKVKPFEIVSQDINGNKLNINLVNDGSLKPYDLTGTTVILYFKRDDGVRLQQYGTIINAPQGQLEIILDTDIIATRGKVFAEVAVYVGEEMKCTSQLFGFYVRKNINDGDVVVSGNDLPNYKRELQRLETTLNNLIISAGDSNPEIVAARYSMLEDKTFTTLGDRLDFIEDALQDIDIDLGPVEQMINNLAGPGRTDETVKGNADKILDLIADVGDLESLDTTEKANLVVSLNEVYQDLVAHKADMTTQLALKSDKAHGGWVDVTLRNGWTGVLQVARLDNGLCILRGQITPGTITALTTIANLPSGYYPYYGMHVTAYLSNGNKCEGFLMNESGYLRVFNNPTLTEGTTIRFTLVYLRGGI